MLLLEHCTGTVVVVHRMHHWHRDEGAMLGRELVGDGGIVVALLGIILGRCILGLGHGAKQVVELGKVQRLVCFQPLAQLNSLRDKSGETSSRLKLIMWSITWSIDPLAANISRSLM